MFLQILVFVILFAGLRVSFFYHVNQAVYLEVQLFTPAFARSTHIRIVIFVFCQTNDIFFIPTIMFLLLATFLYWILSNHRHFLYTPHNVFFF